MPKSKGAIVHDLELIEGLDPGPLLARINADANVREDGRVSYKGWRVHSEMAILHGMFKIAITTSPKIARLCIEGAIGECIRDKKLTKGHLQGVARRLYAKNGASELKAYVLLTQISVQSGPLVGSYRVGKATVRLLRGDYPSKYSSRSKHEEEYRRRQLEKYPADYQNVVVELEARSEELAFRAGLDAVDTLRALINMNVNFALEFALPGNSVFKPINRVMLGGLHTLHSKDGASAYNGFWYEPLAKFEKPHKLKSDKGEKIAKRWTIPLLGQLNRATDQGFADLLRRCLTQYVRAFDEPDPSNCLLRAWSALEQLVGDNVNGDAELVIRRVPFLSVNHEYEQLTLKVIREARNNLAHRSQSHENEHLRYYCYQLQGYFIEAFNFYRTQMKRGRSRDRSNQLLDLAPDVGKLGEDIRALTLKGDLIRAGIKFRTPRKGVASSSPPAAPATE